MSYSRVDVKLASGLELEVRYKIIPPEPEVGFREPVIDWQPVDTSVQLSAPLCIAIDEWLKDHIR